MKSHTLKPTVFRYVWIVFSSILILVGVLGRSVELVNKNYVFLFDQGSDYLAARSIAVDKKFTLIGTEGGAGHSGIRGLFHGPGYHYLLAATHVLFRGDPYGSIVMLFASGLLAILAGYFLVRQWFGQTAAEVAAVSLALSPPLVAQSRMLWAPNASSLFILAAFWLASRAGEGNAWIFLAAFSSAALYNFEIPIAVPMCFALIIYMIFVLRLRDARSYIVSALAFITGLLPMILFDLRHDFLGLRGIVGFLTAPHEGSANLLAEIKGDLSVFLSSFYDTFPHQRALPPLIAAGALAMAVAVFLHQEKNLRVRRAVWYLVIVFLSYAMIYLPYRNALYLHYTVPLSFVFIFCLAYMVSKVISSGNAILSAAVGILLIFLSGYGVYDIFRITSYDIGDYGGTAKIAGKRDALDAIYTDANGEPFGLFIFSPPVYTYPYDYIILWRQQRLYGYVPTKVKDGLYYLLIEPAWDEPWSYQGWLETVMQGGRILKEWRLPSGFIIQKRSGA